MATLSDALKLVERDPPMGFVAIPIAASQPPAKALIVKLKGHTVRLPDWSAVEWLWWGSIALRVAKAQPVANDAGARDKARQLETFAPLFAQMTDLAKAHGADSPLRPPVELVASFYVAAVRVVIASNAAASGPSAGRLAAEAVGAAFLEIPATLGNVLVGILSDAGELFFRDLPGVASKLILTLFGEGAKALIGPLGLSPALLLAAAAFAAWYLTQRSGHGEET